MTGLACQPVVDLKTVKGATIEAETAGLLQWPAAEDLECRSLRVGRYPRSPAPSPWPG